MRTAYDLKLIKLEAEHAARVLLKSQRALRNYDMVQYRLFFYSAIVLNNIQSRIHWFSFELVFEA